MAIWQFQLFVIPKKGLLKKMGEIPKSLEINYEERTTHYQLKEEGLLEESDIFKDALTHDWWSSSEILPIEIIYQIDKRIKRANYGSPTFLIWKFNNRRVDNDASLSINEVTGKIEQLQFRADLREENLKFLREMVDLAEQYEWLLMDTKGNLVEPRLKEVIELVKDSNAFNFLSNPKKFFSDLSGERK